MQQYHQQKTDLGSKKLPGQLLIQPDGRVYFDFVIHHFLKNNNTLPLSGENHTLGSSKVRLTEPLPSRDMESQKNKRL